MKPLLTSKVDRRLASVVRTRMAAEPVILLQGARSVGKSTLLRDLAAGSGSEVIDLDIPATRDAVKADPSLFARGPAPVLIDEYQHVPEILDAIKAELNADLAPGRFVLTGTTSYASLPQAAQSLTGRLHRVDVWPLSQGEILETREDFVEVLLRDPAALVGTQSSETSRDEYVARTIAGGMPLALARDRVDRNRWFDDYVQLVMERDVLDLSRVRQREDLPRLLARLAGQTAQLLNISKAAEAVRLTPDSAERYTRLLEAVFLLYRLPAWGTTLRSRTSSSPKLHLRDSGVAARLLRLSEAKLSEVRPSAIVEFGHLFETFCVNEVLKQLSWGDEGSLAGHWRTHDGHEVDLVIERDDGAIVAIEIKAGERVAAPDLRGLTTLRDILGDAFVGGVVLTTGTRSYTANDRIHVVPADRLWS